MNAFKRFILNLLGRADNQWDHLKSRFRTSAAKGRNTPLSIVAYRGFGKNDYVSLQGRVLKSKPLYGTQHNSFWKSFIDSYRRFETDEISDARLHIRVGPYCFETVTDDEGFFRLTETMDPPVNFLPDHQWFPAEAHLIKTPQRRVNLKQTAEILIPDPRAQFGVVSDIDDTILQTHVTSLLKLKTLYYTIFKNAAGRRPFHEVASFYQALHLNHNEEVLSPFFYVSNSPWNLYDLLLEFLALNHLPKGPILLRDAGIPRERIEEGQKGHKYKMIKHILNTYPRLPFLLIGDSGEKDADIYLEIAREFPERIRSIYIRDVRSHKRARRIAWLIREATGVPIQLIHRYGDAAADAAEKGLLSLKKFEELKIELEGR